ncbi:MAG: MBL fold metallo-hydrolase [Polyangiaceae bacterium]
MKTPLRPFALGLMTAAALSACDDGAGSGGAGGSASTSGSTASTATSGSTSSSSTSTATSSASTGTGMMMSNGFPPHWPDGTSCASEDPIYVWKYSEDTYILRQSLCTSFEGPFLYLLFGQDKVLLEDTGDGGIPVQSTVQAIIDAWLTAHGKASIELVVAHSHGHGDHVAGDGQFAGAPNTTLVGTSASAVKAFFGFTAWPDEIRTFDLGGRALEVIPIPGHQAAHIAIYDPRDRLLLTGDTLYPGRLYVSDFPSYKASTHRLATYAGMASHPIDFVLGTHVEMTTTKGKDFPFQAVSHPNEHALELGVAHLLELDAAVQAMASPKNEVHDDFIVYPL